MLLFLLTSDLLQPYRCENSPIGWDGLKFVQSRDMRYHGISLQATAELTFIKKSGAYLRTAYEARGVEAVVNCTVYQYNANEFRYEILFRGRVDFTQYTVSSQGVTVPLKEVGFTTKFLTRDSTEIDLLRNVSVEGRALPEAGLQSILLHSQQVRKHYRASIDSGEVQYPAGYVTDGESRFQWLYFGFGNVGVDEFGLGQLAGGTFLHREGEQLPPPIYTAKESGDFQLDFNIKSQVRIQSFAAQGDFDDDDITYYLQKNNEAPITLATHRGRGIQRTDIATLNKSYKATIPLAVGDKLYLYGDVHVFEVSGNVAGNYSIEVALSMQAGSYFSMQALSTTPQTYSSGLLPFEVLNRCCQAMTDESRTCLRSSYYGRPELSSDYAIDGPGALRLLTSGFQLRNFPLSEKSLFASFADAFTSLDAIDCVGVGIEKDGTGEIVRVEPRQYFYQSTIGLTLGSVVDLKKKVYPDLLFNTVQVGYSNWQSGAANGLDEFNANRTYSLPLTQLKNEYKAVSPYSASGYLIEEARREQYVNSDTKEGKADSQNFWIQLRRDENQILRTAQNQGFTTVTGIVSPATAYNLALSPSRNLRRHGAWLRAGLVHQVEKSLQKGASEGNDKLVTQLKTESTSIVESVDIPVSDLPAPYLLAETYEFGTRLRAAQFNRLKSQPYQQISFLEKGQRKNGYLLRVEYTPRTQQASFTLIRAV